MTRRRLPPALAAIAATPAGPQVAAFLDFDGTLIPGYSILAFLRQRWRRGVGTQELRRLADMLGEAVQGGLDHGALVARGMREWRGQRLAELEALGEELFARELEPDLFPEMRAIVAAHRARGHTLVLATSSAAFQAAPVARALGIEHLLCTRLATRDGVLTGACDGPVLWGRAKAEAARRFAAEHGVDLAQSFFYADGDEDVALMHLVGEPRPVNPKPRLAAVAARRGWPVQRCTSRGSPGLAQAAKSLAATASAVPLFLAAAGLRAVTGDTRRASNLLTGTLPALVLGLGGVELRVTGRRHLRRPRPAVFIWNHRNIFDAQIVGRLVEHDFGAVAKKELERVPLFAAASRFMHIAFVDRERPQQAVEALQPATALLARGVSMLVAPEGTRVAGGAIGPFKKGAFRMAMAAGVPVIPIVIRNADEVGARNAQVPRPCTVDVAVLPPVDVSDWTLADLDRRIEGVRALFVRTLADWPGGP